MKVSLCVIAVLLLLLSRGSKAQPPGSPEGVEDSEDGGVDDAQRAVCRAKIKELCGPGEYILIYVCVSFLFSL